MTTERMKKFTTREKLEVEILSRLKTIPECMEITHVSVKPTGLYPQSTWEIAGVARRAGTAAKSAPFIHAVVTQLQDEFDLIP
jgi:hypothetical protein